ncbi:hypothetical protein [Microbacterium ulmi]|uniref:Lipoprotein n=1 Tax=Microbacterium ulmi TaxID=179095 RepID=A0A7Y2LY86_9MICO|nr:hypothetical protein [Microbacterium ulmi]NII70790.1 hypothetical protein [Microbacterium ulmi]NNH02807.1 hypothetical protein [Microbacterium ulmi]
MILRRTTAALALALAAAFATGCAPDPEPVETPPTFASEEEAFAAAEETYRAYVDALNSRRSDPGARPSPSSFLIGRALEVDVDTQTKFSQEGLSIVGATRIVDLTHEHASFAPLNVSLYVCLDSSATRVVNRSGQDVTPASRETITLLAVDLILAGEDLAIENSVTRANGSCSV